MKLRIATPEVFLPIVENRKARYYGLHGGRGSGKSHFFAELMVEEAYSRPGFRGVCIRQIQKSIDQSVKQLIADKIAALGLEHAFEIQDRRILTPGNGMILFQGMQSHNATTIKSLEGMDVAWVEEAQDFSERAMDMLRPTIRKPGSQLWFSWNPDSEQDAVDKLLRGNQRVQDAVVVEANYLDNPWIPDELLKEAELDAADPDKFAWVWLGQYRRAIQGAYYADALAKAEAEGRIGSVEVDGVLPIKAAWDIGVADAMTIWIYQEVGGEIRFLDYIEATGQPLGYYLQELRKRGWEEAVCVLPHDGVHRDNFSARRFQDHVSDGGFSVEIVNNQGKGAALQRIEAARRWFPRMRFDAVRTLAGRKALAAYHERIDEERKIGLGPEHDWASHAADSFGLAAVSYVPPTDYVAPKRANQKWIV